MGVIEVDGATFEHEVLTSGIPVVVDFYADWCRPCKAMAPTVHGFARSLADQIRFVKVNVDRSPELAQRFSVRSIPTFIRIDAGEVSRVVVGARSKAGLSQELDLPAGHTPAARPTRAHRWWPRRRRSVGASPDQG